MTTRLPVDVRNELDRIASEIVCIGSLLGRALGSTDIPDSGIEGLENLMYGWYLALKRLTDNESPTGESQQ